MADSTARALRLLSLRQRRRNWPGPELAAQLDVSNRTLRRDINRLSEVGISSPLGDAPRAITVAGAAAF